MKLGAFFDRGGKEVRPRYPDDHGIWRFDEDDYLLMAMLSDPIYCAELLGSDPGNREYGGCFVVRDYQWPLFRTVHNYVGHTCARTVGKTESIKWKSVSHAFRRISQNLLLTAPELIHLLPLTDAIEDKIRAVRLTRDFLETRGGKTGFTHRPFGVDFVDGTKIVGRIPRVTGTGVKGQHQPDLIVDEGQDYPEKGWIEVHETVMKDTVDIDGEPDFTYQFYGVHTGVRDSGFHKRSAHGAFAIVQITALQRPGWGKQEKLAAKAAYGGTSAPDYRRNILGEPGAAASAYFVTSRLVACVDQDRETHYNQAEYRHQTIKVEEFDDLDLPIGEVMDLPAGYSEVWAGMDVGLTNSPTVIMLFARVKEGRTNAPRMKLIRRFTLERMRTRQIREATYAIASTYGRALKGFGMDVTGLGFPMWQEMEDDEAAPQYLMDVARGYFFNAKVPVAVDKEFVTTDQQGRMRDQFGNSVVAEVDPLTAVTRYVTFMPMIEAGTRYLREWVDSTFLLLPFDTEITADMQGETQQRVKRIAGLKNKPNAFHILDAMRVLAMVFRAGDIEEALAGDAQVPVLELTA
jgi:hypothetical protein